MNGIIFDYQILRLTAEFYNAYPDPPYKEILKKAERPYNCLLLQTNYDYFICVPYRTEIKHGYAYKFTKSSRSRSHKSGLDYTKIIIITNNAYIDSDSAVIDGDEYIETVQNIKRITRQARKFVEDYILHKKKINLLNPVEYDRRYRFSPLKYFHKELGLK